MKGVEPSLSAAFIFAPLKEIFGYLNLSECVLCSFPQKFEKISKIIIVPRVQTLRTDSMLNSIQYLVQIFGNK